MGRCGLDWYGCSTKRGKFLDLRENNPRQPVNVRLDWDQNPSVRLGKEKNFSCPWQESNYDSSVVHPAVRSPHRLRSLFLYFIRTWSFGMNVLHFALLSLLYNTNIHDPGEIRTRNSSKRSAADPRLRPLGHWDRGTTWAILSLEYLAKYNEKQRACYLHSKNRNHCQQHDNTENRNSCIRKMGVLRLSATLYSSFISQKLGTVTQADKRFLSTFPNEDRDEFDSGCGGVYSWSILRIAAPLQTGSVLNGDKQRKHQMSSHFVSGPAKLFSTAEGDVHLYMHDRHPTVTHRICYRATATGSKVSLPDEWAK